MSSLASHARACFAECEQHPADRAQCSLNRRRSAASLSPARNRRSPARCDASTGIPCSPRRFRPCVSRERREQQAQRSLSICSSLAQAPRAPMGQMAPASPLPREEPRTSVEESPAALAITDSALQRSQFLLEELLTHGVFDATCNDAAEAGAADISFACKSDDSMAPGTWPTRSAPAAGIPAEVLHMFSELWEMYKADQSTGSDAGNTAAHVDAMRAVQIAVEKMSELHSGDSTKPPSSVDSYTGCSALCSPALSIPTTPSFSYRMSAEDKADIVAELRQALSTSLPQPHLSRVVTEGQRASAPVVIQRCQHVPVCVPPAVQVVLHSPRRFTSVVPLAHAPLVAIPTISQVALSSRGRPMRLKSMVVAQVHHVLTPC